MTIAILPLTAAFLLAVSLQLDLRDRGARVAEQSLGSIVADALTSPLGIGLQVANLILLALVAGGFRPDGTPSASVQSHTPG